MVVVCFSFSISLLPISHEVFMQARGESINEIVLLYFALKGVPSCLIIDQSLYTVTTKRTAQNMPKSITTSTVLHYWKSKIDI